MNAVGGESYFVVLYRIIFNTIEIALANGLRPLIIK